MKKLFILFIIIFITGCSYDEYKMPKDVKILLNKEKINVYEKKNINNLIKKSNVQILNKKKIINTNDIGIKKITITYKFKKRNYKYKVDYEVIDSEKPIFINYASNRTILLENETDFCSQISFVDNYDRNPTCLIDGEIDFNKVGTYNLKYIIKDNSNNTNEEKLTVNIVENIQNSNSNYSSNTKNFSDIIQKYKSNNNEIGIDVSAWQGEIDFNKLKENGCEFVIIRMAYSSEINEALKLDKYFKQNLKNAKKAGLKVGIYFYTNAASVKEVKKQAKFILKNLKNFKLDFPIAYDFESWSNFNEFKLNTHDLDNLFNTFKEVVEKRGYNAMIYSSKYYLEKVWLNEEKNDVWLAHYTDYTNYEGKYILWQLGNTGRINGIYGDVDIDIYYKKKY